MWCGEAARTLSPGLSDTLIYFHQFKFFSDKVQQPAADGEVGDDPKRLSSYPNIIARKRSRSNRGRAKMIIYAIDGRLHSVNNN